MRTEEFNSSRHATAACDYDGSVIVLASQSPRRAEILGNAGIPFVVRPANIAEERAPEEPGEEYARRMAREKAERAPAGEEDIVLGADTVVCIDEHVLGKPRDAGDAKRMIEILSGRWHEVVTGICIRGSSAAIVDSARTRVHFVPLSTSEIEQYVASGEPFDKAGGYAIQGLASKYVDRIEGCYFNVVGLPVSLVFRHLKGLLCEHSSSSR